MLGSLRDDFSALSNWVTNARRNVNSYGVRGATGSLTELVTKGTSMAVGKYLYNYGTPIFEREWDILLVLDACRGDLFEEVARQYNWLPHKPQQVASVGSHTSEWMTKNFVNKYGAEMAETIYITGNPQSQHYISESDWAAFLDPWRHHRNEFGTIPPEVITDYGIDAYRKHEEKRMILHYMQPHQPFRSFGTRESSDSWISNDVWHELLFGEYSIEEVWNAYADNLEWVLEDIERLFRNVDADSVVITSDHGNAFGEFGIYGHPKYAPISAIKQVPWVELPAENTEQAEPKHTIEGLENREDPEVNVEDRLADLGYV